MAYSPEAENVSPVRMKVSPERKRHSPARMDRLAKGRELAAEYNSAFPGERVICLTMRRRRCSIAAMPNRQRFRLLACFAIAFPLFVAGTNGATPEASQWTDIRQLGVEGQGWVETKAPYDRLPAKAEKTVRSAVWNLSRHSAGMHVRFVTDATNLFARWAVTSTNLAMSHMSATGVSGLDLYVKTEKG